MIAFKMMFMFLFIGSISFFMWHVMMNKVFMGDLYFNQINLSLGKTFLQLLGISIVGAIMVVCFYIDTSKVTSSVQYISSSLAALKGIKAYKK